MSASANSAWPPEQAFIRAVSPSSSLASIFAPKATNAIAISLRPCQHAQSRGVHPPIILASMSAPSFIKAVTTDSRPNCAATWNTVFFVICTNNESRSHSSLCEVNHANLVVDLIRKLDSFTVNKADSCTISFISFFLQIAHNDWKLIVNCGVSHRAEILVQCEVWWLLSTFHLFVLTALNFQFVKWICQLP